MIGFSPSSSTSLWHCFRSRSSIRFGTSWSNSFNTPAASIQDRVKLWPRDLTLENYRNVFDSGIIGTAYLNSLFKAVAGTGLILLVNFTSAFGLTDRSLPGIKVVTLFMIFTMFFGGGLIPTYLWVQTAWAGQLAIGMVSPLDWQTHTTSSSCGTSSARYPKS